MYAILICVVHRIETIKLQWSRAQREYASYPFAHRNKAVHR